MDIPERVALAKQKVDRLVDAVCLLLRIRATSSGLMKRSAVVWVLLAMGASTSAAALDWVNFAGVSRKMGISANRLCAGESNPHVGNGVYS